MREGRVFSYIHFNGQVGSLVKISTITDFAARTDEFLAFGKDVVMQIAMTNPTNLMELLTQPFIKEEAKTIEDLRASIIDSLHEDVRIEDFQRFGIK
jgi:elongation factor Ts